MKKIVFTLMALLFCLSGSAQQEDSVYVYSNGRVIRSLKLGTIDSITYSKVGLDGKTYSDYVTQVISASGDSYRNALSAIDSVSFKVYKKNVTPGDAIDLGLSVKWASHNVGASMPEDFGAYYAWGETDEKDNYTFRTYKYYNPDTKECANIGDNICGTAYDVATAKWGGAWRMPSLEEVTELLEKCKHEWITSNGVEGMKFTGPNGNSIFLPAAGWRDTTDVNDVELYGDYWTGSVDKDYPLSSYTLSFGGGEVDWSIGYRSYGQVIRPVRKE